MAKIERMATRATFGRYAINFKGCADTVESVFGTAPVTPSDMTKRLWEYVRRNQLATKG